MCSSIFPVLRLAIVLLVSTTFVSACLSSSQSSFEAQPTNESSIDDSNDGASISEDDIAEGGYTAGENSEDDSNAESPDEVTNGTETEFTTAVPDPLNQSSTRVYFDITVPAYVSGELQVGLVWGDRKIAATWIGNEFWSAFDDLPTNTEHLLTATFYDRNGDIILGRFESDFKTGVNASETYQISAEQLNTDSFDSDNDGVSNIDELIAGTEPFNNSRVLLFSETRAYRHDSIENALEALEELAMSAGIQTDRANDSESVFTNANLARYDAVVWVLTSGDVLNEEEQAAFEIYIQSGGGYAGIHAASDTEYEWPWYGDLVGAYFERHPAVQSARQVVENRSHPSTAHLNVNWTRTDEWYDFRINPRSQVNVLLRLEEESYVGGGMGDDHPSAWYHEYDGGRSWYTGGGHTSASYSEPDFRAHLLGGLRYAAGVD